VKRPRGEREEAGTCLRARYGLQRAHPKREGEQGGKRSSERGRKPGFMEALSDPAGGIT